MLKSLTIIFLVVAFSMVFVTGLVWAQQQGSAGQQSAAGQKEECGPENKLCNPIKTDDFSQTIGVVIKAFLGIIGTISLIMFIYGGITWLVSGGSAAKVKKGQQTLVWASLGILLVFAAYAILKFVFSAFGL